MVNEEKQELKALEGEDLEGVAGGIKEKYVGGANKYNRCKASHGTWTQYCNNPRWVDVGTPYVSKGGNRRKQMICLNCGAQANFVLFTDGSWGLSSNSGTDD